MQLSLFELKKLRLKGLAKSMDFAVIFAIASFALSFSFGIQSSHGIYTYKSDEAIESPLFVVSEDPDIVISGRTVIISGDEKSLAALDDYIKYLDEKYTEELKEKFGIKAFPVFVYTIYLKREVAYTLERKGEEKRTEIQERVESPKPEVEEVEIREERKTLKDVLPNLEKESEKFVPPKDFKPPSLLDRIVLGFIFVIPAYFVMQAYTSSLLEDIRNRRIEIILTIPKGKSRILFEILLPYLLISLVTLIALSIIFRVNAVLYVFPIFIFMFLLQTFLSLSSRSYREATFLLLSSNLFVTAYLFLPAIFTGLPLSEISPITFLLKSFEEKISWTDTAFSLLPIVVLSIFLFLLSTNALSPEIAYSHSSIGEKFVLSLSGLTKSYFGAAFVGFSLVSASLIFEFFALFVATTFLYPLFALLILFALVEEVLKCSALESNLNVVNAVIIPVSFFSFEKLLLLWSVFSKYGELLLGPFLILPLIAHVASSLSFYFTRKLGFKIALFTAFSIHLSYNLLVVL